MKLSRSTGNRIDIVHEIPRRLRIQATVLHDPAFDPAYLEAVLLNVPGVDCVRINTKAASVVVHYDGRDETRSGILDYLEHMPADLFHAEVEHDHPADPVGVIGRSLAALLTPVFPRSLRAPLSVGLALPTLLDGVETLLNRGVKVEVLDASAVGFSLLRRDYFTANAIVALLALGHYMEQLSERKSTDLLKSLLKPQMEFVWVETDGKETRVPLEAVHIGDWVVCGAGEMIPVDGQVAAGEALVNQSAITGESLPVHVQPGDDVLSGSVIEEGRIRIEARQVGADTGMARISRFLQNSLRFKSRSQSESERLADQLVPITFALGLGIYLLTRDIGRAASVLTVDYSCAIKLANPVAVKVAMHTAAQSGILLKGSEALDLLAQVDTLVFDKTGTLTQGVLEVTDVIPLAGMPADELLSLAAGAEEHYSHPVADAVVRAARMRALTLPPIGQVDFIVAHGVSAYIEQERVLVGSYHFIAEDEGIDCARARRRADRLRKQGKSLLFVARGDRLEGIIALRDALRPEADGVLRALKAEGIRKIVVLTGDHRVTALALASGLDAIDDIRWELKPEDKAAIIETLHDQGARTAFIGDGVNDAPALVTADVGICMPSGADLARESADVVLLRHDLEALLTARRIAVQTRRTIRHCFNSAVGVNSLILLLAAGGVLPPVTSAILHNTGTIGILGYAALSGSKNPPSQVP